MKRTLVIAALTVAAAVPATFGLIGNASFGQSVPVRIPPSAILVADDHGTDPTTTGGLTTATLTTSRLTTVTVTRTPTSTGSTSTSRRHGSTTSARPSTTGGDDHGRTTEPGDDHGRTTEPGDDHGSAVEPGDDNGGARTTGSAPRSAPTGVTSAPTTTPIEQGDDRNSAGSTSGTSRGGDNDRTVSGNDEDGNSGRGGKDDGAGHR